MVGCHEGKHFSQRFFFGAGGIRKPRLNSAVEFRYGGVLRDNL